MSPDAAPALTALFIAEGTFEACFSPRRIMYMMRSGGWTYVAVNLHLAGQLARGLVIRYP